MEFNNRLVVNNGSYPLCPRCVTPVTDNMVIYHHPGESAKEISLSEAWEKAMTEQCFIWHKICYGLCWDAM